MSTAIAVGMTAEELLALPEDGMDRELLRGERKEKPTTYRNRFHVQTVAKLTHLLFQWLELNNEETLSGGATLFGLEIAVATLSR